MAHPRDSPLSRAMPGKPAFKTCLTVRIGAHLVALPNFGESRQGKALSPSLPKIPSPLPNQLVRYIAFRLLWNALRVHWSNTPRPCCRNVGLTAIRLSLPIASEMLQGFACRLVSGSDSPCRLAASFSSGVIEQGLSGIDRRQTINRMVASKLFVAREHVYSTYGKVYDFLVSQHGFYRAQNGRFIFVDQPTADRWNSLIADYQAATKRLAEVAKQIDDAQKQNSDTWRRTITN